MQIYGLDSTGWE